MKTITRWDPFRDMMTLQNEMDQVLGHAFRNAGGWSQSDSFWRLPIDVRESEDAFRVVCSVPGVNPDDLDISLVQNVLTIQGEIQPEEQEGQIHLRERIYGTFYRTLQFPSAVEVDQVDAHYENGVLTLTLPKAEEARPKRIAIQSTGHKMIEGKTA